MFVCLFFVLSLSFLGCILASANASYDYYSNNIKSAYSTTTAYNNKKKEKIKPIITLNRTRFLSIDSSTSLNNNKNDDDKDEVRLRDKENNNDDDIIIKRMLVIKVIESSDDMQKMAASSNKSKTYNKIFSMKDYSVASQFAACSYNKFQIEPLIINNNDNKVTSSTFASSSSSTNTDTTTSVDTGIGTINIDMNVNGVDHNVVRDKALSKLMERYGLNYIREYNIDFLLICLPKGTTISNKSNETNWLSYSVISHYLSVYNNGDDDGNNDACVDVSIIMREIGHNLGLGYSDFYDRSCMMSNSYYYAPINKKGNGPRQCFNAVKSWTLGWYNNGHYSLHINDIINNNIDNDNDDNYYTIDLIGVANYNKLQNNQYVIIQIETNTIYNYWIAFNRKETINSQAIEHGDLVLITKRISNDITAESILVASLNIGEAYTFDDLDQFFKIMIQVEDINLNNVKYHDEVILSSSYARIKIGKYESNQPSITIQPTTTTMISTTTTTTTTNNNNTNHRTMFVITVKALDSQITTSTIKIKEKIFSKNTFSATSQYESCSFNKIQFKALHGVTTSTGIKIHDGIGSVTINSNVIGKYNDVVLNDVLSIFYEKYGSNIINDFHIDHLLICLPPGIIIKSKPEWRGYSIVSHYLSVYNDIACTYVSVVMHEIGHNLGLGHSNIDYSDQSCIMGFSYSLDDGPKICFNGVKSWTLGWYNDTGTPATTTTTATNGHISINLSSIMIQDDNHYNIDLLGISNYNMINNNQYVIIQIETNTIYNYWIAFNRKVGINDGVLEGGDLVLITTRNINDTAADSTLVAQLDTHGIYYLPTNVTINENDNEEDEDMSIIIKVEEINFSVEPVYARIFIGRKDHSHKKTKLFSSPIALQPTSSLTLNPTSAANVGTLDPTNIPSIEPTHIPTSLPPNKNLIAVKPTLDPTNRPSTELTLGLKTNEPSNIKTDLPSIIIKTISDNSTRLFTIVPTIKVPIQLSKSPIDDSTALPATTLPTNIPIVSSKSLHNNSHNKTNNSSASSQPSSMQIKQEKSPSMFITIEPTFITTASATINATAPQLKKEGETLRDTSDRANEPLPSSTSPHFNAFNNWCVVCFWIMHWLLSIFFAVLSCSNDNNKDDS